MQETDGALEACQLAKNLARNCGWAVFPCGSDKEPTRPKRDGGNGCHDATRDPERIAWLWRRWPGLLLGVATGEASGFDVLDIDSARHPEAAAWWAVARKRIPPTRTFETRSGGLHVLFRHAEGVRNTGSKLAFGVDTRGTGGYIICWYAAGFACIDHAPIAPWPGWLLECVLWQPPPQEPRQTQASDDDKIIAGLLRAVQTARQGSRNHILFWAANRLRERHFSQADAISRLSGLTDLPAIEAERTIKSAWRASA